MMKSRSSTRTLKKQNNSYRFEESGDEAKQQQWATLKDLCPDEKLKIGQLIQNLAAAKEEKQQMMRDLKEKTKHYKQSIKKIKQHSELVIQEQKSTEIKFRESLTLLKEYQHKFDLITQHSPKRGIVQLETSPQTENIRFNVNRKDGEQQTDQQSFEDINKLKDMINQQNSSKQFLSKKIGESEEKLQQLGRNYGFPTIPTSEFDKEPKQQSPVSEIQRLKLEIDELTNGLKQIQFAQDAGQIEASFSAENQKFFQNQFMKFEAQLQDQDKKVPPRLKKEFASESSSSDTDDVEMARRLLSLKKEKIAQKAILSSNRGQLTRSTQIGDNPPLTSDLQRFNKQLDQKLNSILGSSQSYNLSLTQQQSITPQKTQQSQVTTPADYLQSNSNFKPVKESDKSVQSTPKPAVQTPAIYVQNQDPSARRLFFKKPDESRSIVHSQADEEEIDSLIDSLNNRPSRNYLFAPQSENRPRQIAQSQVIYDGGLYEMVNFIETPKQMEKYEHMMQKMVELYNNNESD